MRSISVTAMACLLALCQPAAADTLLEGLDGRWTGSGWAQPAADAAKEAVRCKLVVTLSASRDRADLRGKCATPGNRYDLRGFFKRQSDGSYQGQWSNPRGEGAVDLTGRRDGDRLVMDYDGRHPENKHRIRGTMTWLIAPDAVVLSNRLTDVTEGVTWETSAMTFAR